MFALSASVVVVAALAGIAAAESHAITFTNNCKSGNPVFVTEAIHNPVGAQTVNGQVLGGIAWLNNFAGANCENNAVNCGAVEFTLRNDSPNQNAADFTLETQAVNGNHQFKYAMKYAYTGGGSCNGISDNCPSQANCPNAFTDPTNGTPKQCIGTNAGIHITFC